jgi:hypothetical protein
MDPKHIVADGYDNIAEQHEKWASSVRIEERTKYTAVLLEKLPGRTFSSQIGLTCLTK